MQGTKKIGVGILGAGRIGRLHAETVAFHVPDAQLVAVADVDASAARDCATRYGARAYQDPLALISDAEVTAVLVCSATDVHAEQVIAAAQQGKDVFCEKPVAPDLKTIDLVLAAVRSSGVKLQVGFNRRFDPSFAAVRAAAESGTLGTLRSLNIISRDPGPPPSEYLARCGGLFLDMAIHDFDMARFMLGDEVQSVFATGRRDDNGHLRSAVTLLEFSKGAVATIDNDRHAVYGYDQRLELFGSDGAAQAENALPHHSTVITVSGYHRPKPLHFFLERYRESYTAELRHFIDCVGTGQQPTVTGRDGRAPVVIALAAQRSVDERRVVEISEF